ncbi:hypothetical protein L1987_33198 [Smallanthus sonchifolius]|uniref:Uncharacterized protein n=1 Tax=Smallanthus sonchifolius TaxID=185202 RepID=A0ACB9HPP7_9ASTR|nr:hypothetical protein L1987_33198 [Smallanthus sonchifolius]
MTMIPCSLKKKSNLIIYSCNGTVSSLKVFFKPLNVCRNVSRVSWTWMIISLLKIGKVVGDTLDEQSAKCILVALGDDDQCIEVDFITWQKQFDTEHPSSDLACETAAGMAATVIAFNPYNSSYLDLL